VACASLLPPLTVPPRIRVWVVQRFRKRWSAIIIYRNSLTAGHAQYHRNPPGTSPFFLVIPVHTQRTEQVWTTLVGLIFFLGILYNASLSQYISSFQSFFFFLCVTAQNIIKQGRGDPTNLSIPGGARVYIVVFTIVSKGPGDKNENTKVNRNFREKK